MPGGGIEEKNGYHYTDYDNLMCRMDFDQARGKKLEADMDDNSGRERGLDSGDRHRACEGARFRKK
ncbi:hypothetical protein PAJ34TS1_45850 [Paenibacillus azoreducens]|uniref:Uncharacterized protein n=1 Tax=Paenibacillus azoreducens TaxID=116718 RepID=A0A919YCS5_9BACL|nr:hypothetical protein J34TS1_28240 [Paenibacillus azoreducens]